MLFTVATSNGWMVKAFNVTAVYLHGKIDEDVWVKVPDGMLSWEVIGTCICMKSWVWYLTQLCGTAWMGRSFLLSFSSIHLNQS